MAWLIPVLPPTEESTCASNVWDLNKISAAEKTGSSEAGHITNDSTTQSNKQAASLVAILQGRVENRL